MVDINLIGDNQAQFDDEDNDKNLQDNFNSEEFGESPYMRGGAIDNQDYTKVIRRSGSKAGVYILFFIVIALLAATAYILFKNPKKTGTQIQNDFQALTEAKVADDTAMTPITSSEEEVTPSTIEYIAPAIKEKIIQSHLGVNTIRQIVNTIPTNVDFTMLNYSDGAFLLELLAQGNNDINNVSSLLKQRLSSIDIKIISRDNRSIKGKQYYQALINGTVNTEQTYGGENIIQQPQFLASEELRQSLANICQESGITMKQFDSGVEKNDGELIVQPIKCKVTGLKANTTSLIQNLLNENINISFEKISLIGNEFDLSNPYFTLVMNLSLYRKI